MTSFSFSHQYDAMQCGVACLQMIGHYYGREKSIIDKRQIDQLSTLSCTFLLTIQPNYVYLQKKRKREEKWTIIRCTLSPSTL